MFLLTDQQFENADQLREFVAEEHSRQLSIWGVQSRTPFEWLAYLAEEFGEIAEAISEHAYREGSAKDVVYEAIQTATLSLKIAEMYLDIDKAKNDPDWPWKNDKRPILCLDFDGVIHSYASGWKGPDIIPDPPVTGAIKWLEHMLRDDAPFRIGIFSSRSQYDEGLCAMARYLAAHGLSPQAQQRIDWPTEKPPAFCTIDDRALRFMGVFPLEADLLKFTPWNKKKPERA